MTKFIRYKKIILNFDKIYKIEIEKGPVHTSVFDPEDTFSFPQALCIRYLDHAKEELFLIDFHVICEEYATHCEIYDLHEHEDEFYGCIFCRISIFLEDTKDKKIFNLSHEIDEYIERKIIYLHKKNKEKQNEI